MRNKILLAISAFIFTCIGMTSCLSSEEPVYKTDARILGFGLDSVFGKYYKFEIDHLLHLIYNRDSMPVSSDTVLDSILVDTFSVLNYALVGPKDSLFDAEVRHDLRGAINRSGESGISFKVTAPDAVSTTTYYLEIRVHKQEPDSVVWRQKETFSAIPSTGNIKAVTVGENLWVLTSPGKAYRTSVETGAFGWTEVNISGLPADADVTSATVFQNKLYVISADGDLYESADGSSWNKHAALSGGLVTLLGTVAANKEYNTLETFCAVRELDGKRYFCATSDMNLWTIGAVVPENFPSRNIVSVHHASSTGLSKTVIVGMPHTSKEATVPWFTMDGTDWANMNALQNGCPALDNPFIAFFNNKFYMYGGSLENVYESLSGIGWYEIEKKFTLPTEFKNRTSYTIAEDKYHAMWVIFGGNGSENEVWRGRMNVTAFEIQR